MQVDVTLMGPIILRMVLVRIHTLLLVVLLYLPTQLRDVLISQSKNPPNLCGSTTADRKSTSSTGSHFVKETPAKSKHGKQQPNCPIHAEVDAKNYISKV